METLVKLPNSQMHREWLELYGQDTWQEVGNITDLLPVAAIVDDTIFLTKSGLPLPIKNLAQIEALNIAQKEAMLIDSALVNGIL